MQANFFKPKVPTQRSRYIFANPSLATYIHTITCNKSATLADLKNHLHFLLSLLLPMYLLPERGTYKYDHLTEHKVHTIEYDTNSITE